MIDGASSVRTMALAVLSWSGSTAGQQRGDLHAVGRTQMRCRRVQ